jgi:predicted dehydrogenase
VSIKVGVIGVGYLGQHHARVFSGLEGVDLVGVADVDSRIAGEIAGKFNCGSFSSYTDLIKACDVLSIVTPTTTHHAIGMDCQCKAKRPFIEKPITERLDEAGSLLKPLRKTTLFSRLAISKGTTRGLLRPEMVADLYL